MICKTFDVSRPTAQKYISMTPEEINRLDHPRNYKIRDRAGNDFVNIIYKMMADGYDDEIIYQYLRKTGITVPRNSLLDYINAISKENFPDRKRIYGLRLVDEVYPEDVTVIRRTDLLRHILTIDPKKQKEKTITENMKIIRETYPIVAWVETAFHTFHSILKGNDPDKVEEYINNYKDSAISSFCEGLKKDIAPVKNAISLSVSSGFVEGNNNKFKLIKRIVYGRSKLVNLTKNVNLLFSSRQMISI